MSDIIAPLYMIQARARFNIPQTSPARSDKSHEKDEQGGTGKAFEELSEYLVNGVVATGAYLKLPLLCGDEIGSTGQYEHYFAWDQDFPTDEQACRPTTALLPKNCERMKKQSGQYVFYDLRSKMREDSSGKKNYNSLSMENLHCEYVNLVRENHLPETPFLCEVNINRYAYKAFVGYAKAIGLRKYHVYPELDKLAKDMLQLLGF